MGDDFEPGFALQQAHQALAKEAVVVDQENADAAAHGVRSKRWINSLSNGDIQRPPRNGVRHVGNSFSAEVASVFESIMPPPGRYKN
jgi:hypothetical protein